jgi:hypothetical protein
MLKILRQKKVVGQNKKAPFRMVRHRRICDAKAGECSLL